MIEIEIHGAEKYAENIQDQLWLEFTIPRFEVAAFAYYYCWHDQTRPVWPVVWRGSENTHFLMIEH
jgi:hypothetical protein